MELFDTHFHLGKDCSAAEIMEKIDIIYDVDEYNITEIADRVKAVSHAFINKII